MERHHTPKIAFGGAFVDAEEMARPCSCYLKASSMANNDNRACNPCPAILGATSLLELEAFVLREADKVESSENSAEPTYIPTR
jgi:hypothetical protein